MVEKEELIDQNELLKAQLKRAYDDMARMREQALGHIAHLEQKGDALYEQNLAMRAFIEKKEQEQKQIHKTDWDQDGDKDAGRCAKCGHSPSSNKAVGQGQPTKADSSVRAPPTALDVQGQQDDEEEDEGLYDIKSVSFQVGCDFLPVAEHIPVVVIHKKELEKSIQTTSSVGSTNAPRYPNTIRLPFHPYEDNTYTFVVYDYRDGDNFTDAHYICEAEADLRQVVAAARARGNRAAQKGSTNAGAGAGSSKDGSVVSVRMFTEEPGAGGDGTGPGSHSPRTQRNGGNGGRLFVKDAVLLLRNATTEEHKRPVTGGSRGASRGGK